MELSVLIPLTDSRGDAVKHLRTWTHGQTIDRDRYQVVVVSDGEDPAGDQAVARLLQPHDVFQTAAGANVVGLWDQSTRAAGSNWLLITENHCEGEPDCVERTVEGIQANPHLEAASIEHGHIVSTSSGQLVADWFDQVYEDWFSPGEWRRLNLAGFVIRRDAYVSAGGYDDRYGLFAAALLAARLDQRGARVGHLPEARIRHVHVEELEEHHHHSASYARGECEARPSLDPHFAETYFGHQHLLRNRSNLDRAVARQASAVIAREVAWAARQRPSDLPWLLGELAARLPPAVAGVRSPLLLTRLAFGWSELLAGQEWVPRRHRYRHYLRAQDRVVRLTQLRWIGANSNGGGQRDGSHADRLKETAVGVHGFEMYRGRAFRWSEPVVRLRVDDRQGGEVRIDTGGLRGPPLSAVSGAYLGTTRLARSSLREDGPILGVELPENGIGDLTLLCRPLTGQGEERRLGLPLFSVETH